MRRRPPVMMAWNQCARPTWREVLLAAPVTRTHEVWRGELDRLLAPQRVSLRHSGTWQETIAQIEAGGVDLAVLWADSAGMHGLRTLEIVRSLTRDLPCLLITPDTSGPTLCRALALQAYSVIHQPVNAHILAALLVRILRKES